MKIAAVTSEDVRRLSESCLVRFDQSGRPEITPCVSTDIAGSKAPVTVPLAPAALECLAPSPNGEAAPQAWLIQAESWDHRNPSAIQLAVFCGLPGSAQAFASWLDGYWNPHGRTYDAVAQKLQMNCRPEHGVCTLAGGKALLIASRTDKLASAAA